MLRGERPTMVGRHYSVSDAINEPPPISRIPVMIGGSGERKTLRLVARYGDESNLTCSVDEVPRKLDALARHCDDIGRDRSEITVSLQQICLIAPTHEQAMDAAAGFFGPRGIDLTAMDDGTRDRLLAAFVVGGPDEVGEQLTRRLESGVDGFTLSLPVNGHELEPIELLGQVATAVVGAKG
jgi:alkanesulfonate monooxygenase SsuD/methylene tetrahydromethanopterin reductase-like flavin-dependent oxidoreductase (luciferase family)